VYHRMKVVLLMCDVWIWDKVAW